MASKGGGMSDKQTGGSAFPVSEVLNRNGETIQYPSEGMTLRDYFAAKAMQAFLTPGGSHEYKREAEDAYKMADAMLKAREA